MGPAQKSGTVHDISETFVYRLEKPKVIARVIFEVCVLHNHDLTPRFFKATAQSGTFAAISVLKDDPYVICLQLPLSAGQRHNSRIGVRMGGEISKELSRAVR